MTKNCTTCRYSMDFFNELPPACVDCMPSDETAVNWEWSRWESRDPVIVAEVES